MLEVKTPHAEIADSASYDFLQGRTGENCQPSPECVADLRAADLVLVSGQFVGAGKSTFITTLEQDGYHNVASWTNRDLRPGEVEGVDKCHKSLGEMSVAAEAGRLLELEEVRPGMFYATPSIEAGQPLVKDLELKGALRLRSFAPKLPIIVPLPPLDELPDLRVTEWERRVALREGFAQAVTGKAITDLEGRLQGVVEESQRILELNLHEDPNTLVIVNGELETALQAMRTFLATGQKTPGIGLDEYLQALHTKALDALQATK